jgi:methylated-DNA-[protein]-cysteine S-methyltransferase
MSKHENVTYALVEGPAGTGLVASRGGEVVASFLPGGEPVALAARLRERFPDAVEADPSRVPGAAELRRWLEGDPSGLARVPVALEGVSPFTAKVYRELRRVPPGKTVTYGDLARRAGSPAAARAVGRAMATNPLAPFVPCHRVLGSGGALTGFSAPGGVDGKKRFLETEARWAGSARAKP